MKVLIGLDPQANENNARRFFAGLQSTTALDSSITAARQAFYSVIEDQYVINVAKYIVTKHITTAKTPANVQQLFVEMNSNASACTPNRDALQPAPLVNCSSFEPWMLLGTHFTDTTAVNSIANDVAQKIADAQNNGTIQNLANQHDLFSSFEKNFLDFYLLTDTTTSGYMGPCYLSGVAITGASPSIFIYPSHSEMVSVMLPDSATYADPSPEGSLWNMNVKPNGDLKIYDENFHYLYYEYTTQIHFTQPTNGFIVTSNNWQEILNSIANKLSLTESETNRLSLDIQKIINSYPQTEYFKLSLADQTELNTLLPLHINPAPTHLYRINIIVHPLSADISLQQPTLTPLSRSGFTVVEVGAREE